MLSLPCCDVRQCAYMLPLLTQQMDTLHTPLRHNLPYVVLDQLPPPSHISHIPQFNIPPAGNSVSIPESPCNAPTDDRQPKDPHVTYIGAALLPISTKLLQRIEQGTFIEMAELLPESLGHLSSDEDRQVVKPKRRMVSDIVEWLQCFGLYIAIISRKQPARVLDLLGYQNLIIQAYQEYRLDCWLGYDHRFRQQAAATPTRWAVVDPTLWNLAFFGRAGTSRCHYCFSLSHCSSDCEILLNTQRDHTSSSGQFSHTNIPPNNMTRPSSRNQPRPNQAPPTQLSATTPPVCYSYNETPKPGCLFPYCLFEHSCYWCLKNPDVFSKRHKAIFCPNKARPPR